MTLQSCEIPRLSVQDVAKRLNVSRQFVYRLINEGRLRHFVLGGHSSRGTIRVTETAFTEYIAASQGKRPAISGLPVYAEKRQKTELATTHNISARLTNLLSKKRHV